MTPEQASKLRSELANVSGRAETLTFGMDAAALTRRPATGGWSVAENLQHLILTAEAMLPLTEAAIVELERDEKRANGSSRLGLMGWLLVKSLEPPARIKTRTSAPFEPASVDEPLSLPGRFQEANARFETLIERATGLATTAVKVTSPFNTKVKYNLYAALRILLVHTRRHLWQAEQVKAGTRT